MENSGTLMIKKLKANIQILLCNKAKWDGEINQHDNNFQQCETTEHFDALKTLRINRSRP